MYHFNVYLAFSCILGVCSACYTRRRLCIFWCVSLLYIYIYIIKPYVDYALSHVRARQHSSRMYCLYITVALCRLFCVYIFFLSSPPPRGPTEPRETTAECEG